MTTGSGDDRLPFLVRAGFTPLAVATAIFGPMLLLRPGDTADYWAWRIAPDMSAVWVGAGYTFGAVAITTMLLVGRWSAAIVPVVSTWPFAIVMLVATIIHNDRFFTDTGNYGVWLLIYVVLPFALPAMYWQGRSHSPPPSAQDTMLPQALRYGFVAAGLVALVLGLTLVLTPSALKEAWPWNLTPLMSRVVGGWLLFIATGGLCPLFERRYKAYRFYLPVAAFWFAVLLVASLLNRNDFDSDRLATPLYFAALGITVVALLVISAYLEMLQQVRDHAYAAAVSHYKAAERKAKT